MYNAFSSISLEFREEKMNIYENLKLMREDQLLLLKKLQKKINGLAVNLMSKKQKLTLRGVTYEFDLNLDKNIKYMIIGEYQRDVVELLERYLKDSDTFIDIGANIGYMTFIAAGLVGKKGQVHSFEPMPMYFEYLSKFAKDNPERNIFVNNVGLGDTTEVKKMDFAVNNIRSEYFYRGRNRG